MKKREVEALFKQWSIGDLVSCKQIEKGVVNINWILKTTEGKYILRKVTQPKSKTEMEFELGYLSFLKEHGFPYKIPLPIKTKSGDPFLKLKGFHFWIYQYIEGRDAESFDYHKLKETAKMMATYHRIIEHSSLDNRKGKGEPFNREPVISELLKFREQILRKEKQRREDKIFLKESSTLIPLIRNLRASQEYSKLPTYPLHRDINPENILWKNKKLVGLVDFENTSLMNETIVKDVSIMLQYACRDQKKKHKLDLKRASFFLKEYRKHHPLSDMEIESLPDIITAGSIEDFAYAYWMLTNDRKRAKLYRLKLYSQVAWWYQRNKARIIEKLKSTETARASNYYHASCHLMPGLDLLESG